MLSIVIVQKRADFEPELFLKHKNTTCNPKRILIHLISLQSTV